MGRLKLRRATHRRSRPMRGGSRYNLRPLKGGTRIAHAATHRQRHRRRDRVKVESKRSHFYPKLPDDAQLPPGPGDPEKSRKGCTPQLMLNLLGTDAVLSDFIKCLGAQANVDPDGTRCAPRGAEIGVCQEHNHWVVRTKKGEIDSMNQWLFQQYPGHGLCQTYAALNAAILQACQTKDHSTQTGQEEFRQVAGDWGLDIGEPPPEFKQAFINTVLKYMPIARLSTRQKADYRDKLLSPRDLETKFNIANEVWDTWPETAAAQPAWEAYKQDQRDYLGKRLARNMSAASRYWRQYFHAVVAHDESSMCAPELNEDDILRILIEQCGIGGVVDDILSKRSRTQLEKDEDMDPRIGPHDEAKRPWPGWDAEDIRDMNDRRQMSAATIKLQLAGASFSRIIGLLGDLAKEDNQVIDLSDADCMPTAIADADVRDKALLYPRD